MSKVKVPAGDVKVGDKLYFPNSRKAQEVEEVNVVEGIAIIKADRAEWNVPVETEVEKDG